MHTYKNISELWDVTFILEPWRDKVKRGHHRKQSYIHLIIFISTYILQPGFHSIEPSRD